MFSRLSLAFLLLAVLIGVATSQEPGKLGPLRRPDGSPDQEKQIGMNGPLQPADTRSPSGSAEDSGDRHFVFRPLFRPGFGSGARPGFGSGFRPGLNPGFRPGSRPGYGSGIRPGFGPGFRPGSGPALRPGLGAGLRPGFGPGFRPVFGHRPIQPCPCLSTEGSSTPTTSSSPLLAVETTTSSVSSNPDSIISTPTTDSSAQATDSSIETSTSSIAADVRTTTIFTPILITTSDLSIDATTKLPDPDATTPGIEYYDYDYYEY